MHWASSLLRSVSLTAGLGRDVPHRRARLGRNQVSRELQPVPRLLSVLSVWSSLLAALGLLKAPDLRFHRFLGREAGRGSLAGIGAPYRPALRANLPSFLRSAAFARRIDALLPAGLAPVACCQLPVASCQLPVLCCRLPVPACRLLPAVCCLPFAACRSRQMSPASCMQPAAYARGTHIIAAACCLLCMAVPVTFAWCPFPVLRASSSCTCVRCHSLQHLDSVARREPGTPSSLSSRFSSSCRIPVSASALYVAIERLGVVSP